MRHDSISLKMDEFARTLADIAELKKDGQWPQIERLNRSAPSPAFAVGEATIGCKTLLGATICSRADADCQRLLIIVLNRSSVKWSVLLLRLGKRGGTGWIIDPATC